MGGARLFTLVLSLASACAARPAGATEPWIITSPVKVTTPLEVGHVIIADGGYLEVSRVPEPGFRVSGNLICLGTGRAYLHDSVAQVMSTYHGQFATGAMEQGTMTIARCDYRVPSGVQHALIAGGTARVSIRDTDFAFVQLATAQQGTLSASGLNGQFEVVVMDESRVVLADIPRESGKGGLWVWPEFPRGSKAIYTPPLPGLVEKFTFPPPGSEGIEQRISLTRCSVKLWPMLVRDRCDLTLRDIPEDNWVVVGFHMPNSSNISGLRNGTYVADGEVPLKDRTVRLERASIDTFNLYPQKGARVVVEDSTVGEILAMDRCDVVLRRVVIDGSGGYFGAEGTSSVSAEDSRFTCDVQASDKATMILRRCKLLPYPLDPTGAYTRCGAFDTARILLDATTLKTTPALGGQGLIAASWIANLPAHPPAQGEVVQLSGTAAQYSLSGSVAPGRWRLDTVKMADGSRITLGRGDGDITDALLGSWSDADPSSDYELRVVLTDGLNRKLVGRYLVPRGTRIAVQ
ncbi:MAG: hypothetical protein AB1714_29625 [Acidobacteriota bacterium]